MRALVIALALLAGLKIWIQHSVHRTATEEALVLAYRGRAADACLSQSAAAGLGSAHSVDWTAGGVVPRVEIGNPALPVRIWQYDHELWEARFRRPYLVLSAETEGATLSCSYDILAGTAAIARS